jgi:O-antigen ligase
VSDTARADRRLAAFVADRSAVVAGAVIAYIVVLTFAPRTGPGRVVYWAGAYGVVLLPLVALWPLATARAALRRLSWFDIAPIALLAWVLVSIVVVTDAPHSTGSLVLEAWLKIASPVALYLAIRLTGLDLVLLARWRWIIGAALVALALLTVVSVASPDSLPSFWPAHGSIRDERATGPFSGPVPLTMVTGFLVVMATAPGWPRRPRWWTGSACALGALVIALTYLRAAWLGLVAGLLVAVVAAGGRRVALRIGAVVAVAAIVGAIGLATSEHARDRITSDRQVESRIVMGAAGVRMVADRPLAGYGWFAYDVHDTTHLEPVFGIEPGRFERTATSHNSFLTVGAELGLVGLALAIVAPLAAVVIGARHRADPTAPALLGLITMCFVLAMTSDVRNHLADLAVIGATLGLLANLRNVSPVAGGAPTVE